MAQHLSNGEEVAQAFGHFLVVHANKTVVHPEPGHGLAKRAFALCDFVFMVRKLQISPATMDIKAFAQGLAAHGRAFNVPTGAPRYVIKTHGLGVPLGIVWFRGFRCFPQHKVQWVFLAVGHRHPLTGTQLIERLPRQAPVPGKLANRVVHVTVVGLVGQTFRFQLTDHTEHFGNVVRGAWFDGGWLDAQPANVTVHGGDHLIGQRPNGDAPLERSFDDLVVNVGDVANIGDAVTAALQPPLGHIKRHHHAGMPNVTQVINGHSTDVHSDMARLQWRKRFKTTR